MKFLVSKNAEYSQLLLYLMRMVVISIMLYLLLDVMVHGYLLGWNITELNTTLYGNMDSFEEPILLDSLLLQVHLDLFMSIFALLILSSILIRFSVNKTSVKLLLHTVLLSALFAPIFLLFAYFMNLYFLYLWIATFFLWHGIALFIALIILKKMWFK